MAPPRPLYRVSVNSSGLIYAVIVGAWAAYLVPMWLRRQDELNESRPTERFSTAIRLLSGKAAMERRYAREADRLESELPDVDDEFASLDGEMPPGADEGLDGRETFEDADESVDVRAFADPKTMVRADVPDTDSAGAARTTETAETAEGVPSTADGGKAAGKSGRKNTGKSTPSKSADPSEREKARQKNMRAKVLARRRRTTMVLFLAFTAGAIVAAVGGLAFLWAPVLPGALLSTYIVHLRVQERRRFAAVMDKRRAAEPTAVEPEAAPPVATAATEALPASAADQPAPPRREAPRREPRAAAGRRAVVEQTDHAEWVDQQRDADREPTDGWDPVPVPLPTYVSAPVAPRSTRGVDLESPDTWSSARSSSAAGDSPAEPGAARDAAEDPPTASRRTRGRRETPLFDQYEGEDRPRAANE
jgi:hypothetical protein